MVCRLLTGASTSETGTAVRKLQPAASTFDQVRTTSLPLHGSLVSIWPLWPAATERATCASSGFFFASWARLTLPLFLWSGLESSMPLAETANA